MRVCTVIDRIGVYLHTRTASVFRTLQRQCPSIPHPYRVSRNKSPSLHYNQIFASPTPDQVENIKIVKKIKPNMLKLDLKHMFRKIKNPMKSAHPNSTHEMRRMSEFLTRANEAKML